MSTRFLSIAALSALALSLLIATHAAAQSSPVANLRLVDETGAEITRAQAGEGDQIYALPEGESKIRVAFDFSGSASTDVQVRILGTMGNIIFQQAEVYDAPGNHTIDYENESPLQVGEYVVNVYVGEDAYLADSFQLAVGDEVLASLIATPDDGAPQSPIPTPDAPAPAPTLGTPVDEGSTTPGASPMLLALAGLGMILLFGIVLWAIWSAMRRS
jgi:hypothetical protein